MCRPSAGILQKFYNFGRFPAESLLINWLSHLLFNLGNTVNKIGFKIFISRLLFLARLFMQTKVKIKKNSSIVRIIVQIFLSSNQIILKNLSTTNRLYSATCAQIAWAESLSHNGQVEPHWLKFSPMAGVYILLIVYNKNID